MYFHLKSICFRLQMTCFPVGNHMFLLEHDMLLFENGMAPFEKRQVPFENNIVSKWNVLVRNDMSLVENVMFPIKRDMFPSESSMCLFGDDMCLLEHGITRRLDDRVDERLDDSTNDLKKLRLRRRCSRNILWFVFVREAGVSKRCLFNGSRESSRNWQWWIDGRIADRQVELSPLIYGGFLLATDRFFFCFGIELANNFNIV